MKSHTKQQQAAAAPSRSAPQPWISTPQGRNRRTVHAATFTVTVLVFAMAAILETPAPLAAEFVVEDPRRSSAERDVPHYREHLASNRTTVFVHSAAKAEMSHPAIRSFWMGGTREGHRDVKLYTAVFDLETRAWSPERVIMSVDLLKRQLGRNIVTLGNPVAMRHDDGRMFLWFVSVSMGGWSGSSINLMISHDDGVTWDRPRRLITTPMFNLSTLVKCPPITFADGTIGLPVYHENLGKFGELLRLDSHGRVLHKQRLTWGRSSLQPEIAPLSRTEAVAFLRRAGSAPRRVLRVTTNDGGRTWSEREELDMPNPGGPVSVANLGGGELLIAFNNTEHGRDKMSLAVTKDAGETYTIIHEFEDREMDGVGVSYPSFLQTESGDLHLSYTLNREYIRHVHFNLAWVDETR